jgi:hypothetical protein
MVFFFSSRIVESLVVGFQKVSESNEPLVLGFF